MPRLPVQLAPWEHRTWESNAIDYREATPQAHPRTALLEPGYQTTFTSVKMDYTAATDKGTGAWRSSVGSGRPRRTCWHR